MAGGGETSIKYIRHVLPAPRKFVIRENDSVYRCSRSSLVGCKVLWSAEKDVCLLVYFKSACSFYM